MDLKCFIKPYEKGIISEMFGNLTISINQTSSTTIHLELLNSFYPSLSTTPLHCDYSQCQLLSSVDCSTYISDFSNCIRCNSSQCVIHRNMNLSLYQSSPFLNTINHTLYSIPFYQNAFILQPFLSLFSTNNTQSDYPSVFGCKDDGECRWVHVE